MAFELAHPNPTGESVRNFAKEFTSDVYCG